MRVYMSRIIFLETYKAQRDFSKYLFLNLIYIFGGALRCPKQGCFDALHMHQISKYKNILVCHCYSVHTYCNDSLRPT